MDSTCHPHHEAEIIGIVCKEETAAYLHFLFLTVFSKAFPQHFLQHFPIINPLPDDKILDLSKLKPIADNILTLFQNKF